VADPVIGAAKHLLRAFARGLGHLLQWLLRVVSWPVRAWWRAFRHARWLVRTGLAALAGGIALVAWLAVAVPWPGYLFTPPFRAVEYGPVNDLQYLRPGTRKSDSQAACTRSSSDPCDKDVDTWQGLTEEERRLYYQHPQGSAQVMLAQLRYAWFINLEKAGSRDKFAAPENMSRYGFLTDIQQRPDPRWNPGNLPVGFTKYYDERLNAELVDFTCSLCHTGELHYRGTAIRVLGGPAMHAITDMKPGQFQMEMMSALLATYLNPVKFNRFAHDVIDPTVPASLKSGFDFGAARKQLRSQVGETIGKLLASAWADLKHGNYPVFEGYGRIDAVQRIANTVFGHGVSPSNFRAATAPVNYPFLWDIGKFNWVQYEGYASQPMARNINESLGTGARLDAFDEHGAPLPMHLRYGTSVQPDKLHAIERMIDKLEAPSWPENLFGRIDVVKARKGRALFDVNCRHCHGPHTGPADVDPTAPQDENIAAPLHFHTRDDCSEQGTCDASGVCLVKGTCPQVVTCALTVVDDSQPGDGPVVAPRTRDVQLTDQQCLNLQNPQRVADIDGNLVYKLDSEGRVVGLAECDKSKQDCARWLDHVPEWQISLLSIRDVGTDRNAALSFVNNRYDASHLGWTAGQLQQLCMPDDEIDRIGDAKQVSAVEGLNIMSLSIARRYFREHPAATPEELMKYMGFGILDFPQTDPTQLKNYKSRPLHGVWATPPFLHNGSVRTIFQMISPREEREREFWSGTKEYDPVQLGYRNLDVPGAVRFKTDVTGNDNVGHEFRDGCQSNGVIGRHLEVQERYEILEYIKAMDYTAGDDDYEAVLCPTDRAGSKAEQEQQKAACFAQIRGLKAAEAARTPRWGSARFLDSRSERHCSDDALIYGDAVPKTPSRNGVWNSWGQVSTKKCSVYRMLRNVEGTPVDQ
jgi:RoxA-like, cytochrome c-like